MKQDSFIDKVSRPSRELQRSQDYIAEHAQYIRRIEDAQFVRRVIANAKRR